VNRRTKDGEQQATDRSGYVHCARNVAYKQVAAREEPGEARLLFCQPN